MAYGKRKSSTGRVLDTGIYERKDGRFQYKYVVGGKIKYLYDKDLQRLRQKIVDLKFDMKSGTNMDIANMTLNQYYNEVFIKNYKCDLRDATVNNMKDYYKWYVKDFHQGILGEMKVKDIRQANVIAHFREVVEVKELKDSTLQMIFSYLYNCFETLQVDGVININPLTKIHRYVKGEESERREALEPEVVQVMIEFLQQSKTYNYWLPILIVALSTGLRIGELIALTWRDIDEENKKLYVYKKLQYRNGEDGHRVQKISSPKTPSGHRVMPLTDEAIEMLHKQKKYQRDLRIRQDYVVDGYKGFIFTTKMGRPYTNDAVGISFKRIIKACNKWEEERAIIEGRYPIQVPDHSPHYWRHTFATKVVEGLINKGTDNALGAMILKDLMGHRKLQTSIDVYTTISEKIKQQEHRIVENTLRFLS